jgi:hypothetical protein
MISSDDLKEGTYLQTTNNHGRLVLRIIKQFQTSSVFIAYECQIIEGKLNSQGFVPLVDIHLKSYMFGKGSLIEMEIAHDYTREEKLKELGI